VRHALTKIREYVQFPEKLHKKKVNENIFSKELNITAKPDPATTIITRTWTAFTRMGRSLP